MILIYNPDQYAQQRQHEKKRWIYPVRLAMEATYMRDQGHDVLWDPDMKCSTFIQADKIITKPEGLDFDLLPAPDRILTNALDPKYQENGNFKYTPATYTLAASGCWWGKCSFCVEKNEHYKVRSVSSLIQELGELFLFGPFQEVFDDSGTFPDGEWLREFCKVKIESGLGRLPISCNMRIGADVDFDLMKRANFRMLLYGVESASQKTLDTIQKGINREKIVSTLQQAAKAGLAPHIAVMFGYPWESDKDSRETLRLVHYLLQRGYAKTAQASFFSIKNIQSNEKARKNIEKIYDVWKNPLFWYNKIIDIRSPADAVFLWKQIKSGLRRGR